MVENQLIDTKHLALGIYAACGLKNNAGSLPLLPFASQPPANSR